MVWTPKSGSTIILWEISYLSGSFHPSLNIKFFGAIYECRSNTFSTQGVPPLQVIFFKHLVKVQGVLV
jgi:hypothetical protein